MHRPPATTTLAVFGSALVLIGVFMSRIMLGVETEPPNRSQATRLFREGNWNEAFGHYRRLCLDPRDEPAEVPRDLNQAVDCLNRLGRIAEFDALVEGTVEQHGKNWRLLHAAARLYQSVEKNGFIVGGKFERGPHRGGGTQANTLERDRVRALQLMQQAMPLADVDGNKGQVAAFLLDFARLVRTVQTGDDFRLQTLTDLTVLPDVQEGDFGLWQPLRGAPVDPSGQPVFYSAPKTWQESQSDGQRWRWLLGQAEEVDPGRRNEARWQFAEFLWQQFDVQTLLEHGFFPLSRAESPTDSGTYALHTLGETETIARLATGVKRFTLPDEFNFIRVYQSLAAEPRTGYGENALHKLAEIFENRRQYPRAAGYWKQSIDLYGPGQNNHKTQRLQQIVGRWGRFEPVSTQPAGKGATVEFLFRNATTVSLEAHRIDVPKLLADIKAYLKSNPQQIDWQKLQIENVGWRLVQENQRAYLGPRVATWTQQLEPRENHFDRRITITTPLREAGAYLVTATLGDGNVSKIVLWVDDTVIVHKQLSGGNFYYVADATTGRPIANANVEFVGYRQEVIRTRNQANQFRIVTKNFAEATDAQGQLIPDARDLSNDFQWLVIARTKDGHLAHHGFRGVWSGDYHDEQYNQVKVFCITDRPVYRPQQKLQFKFWVRRAQYDNDGSEFARQTFPVELHNPTGEKVQSWSLTTDDYGGLVGEWEIPAAATLGQYQLVVAHDVASGGGSFRVEEYKKPEFEVTVAAPREPVMLGEKITAKIEAKYYFGAPVVNATVKYKVLRSEHQQNWYPAAPWDWCFGKGYWWFSYDAPWYPGWSQWAGCVRPWPWWFPMQRDPPEVVAERELPIGPDGTVSVEIDTALAKELHGDSDHEYSITVEVRDESRRTIVGQGHVLVARQPFKVFTWVDRGYYRVGDAMAADFLAQTLDNQPVKGAGKLRLLKVTYPDPQGQPVETEVQSWELNTDDAGRARQTVQASAAGQYRLSYQVTDAKEHVIEGGYLLTIMGEGFDGRGFRFNHLELVPDQREYAPGGTVRLQVNTDRVGSTVLLFVRPANGIYLKPQLLRLAGKSAVQEIAVMKKDMPNFFVEAVTIADGKVYSESRELVVPPEKRVLNVEVLPSDTDYKPGQKARVKVHLTDFQGENFIGQTVAAIYDKSVEYIAGGSNVPDIKEFFWKWRRQHQPQTDSNLDVMSDNMTLPSKPGMGPIGVFGDSVADEVTKGAPLAVRFRRSGMAGGGMMMGGAEGGMSGMMLGARAMSAAPPGGPAGLAAAEGSVAIDFLAETAGQAAETPLVMPTVRSEFADTALWVGQLETDRDGIAEVSLDMPENLTTWKIRVWGMGRGTQVGSGETEVITRKDLIVRLQAPRFLVQQDEVVLSANIHNYLAAEKRVTAVLEVAGGQLRPLGETTTQVTVPADGERRVDWRVAVVEEGQVTIRMKALTDEESDAMEVKIPCYVHGMLKTESWAGTIRPEQDRAQVTVRVPEKRRPEQSLLEVRYSPTLAAAMVDALPYLAEYPYGCTEQTLNRFLPSVITQKILLQMNVNLEEIREQRTNLNAQELGDAAQRARQWKRFDRNPVFDRAELDRMVKEGVTALTNMQCSDGGWGWFSGYGERSWPHTTAVVVHGLQVARQNDVPLVPNMLERGIAWLQTYQAEQIQQLKNAPRQTRPWKTRADELDSLVHLILVEEGSDNAEMREFLYRDRNDLAVYAQAVLGLALEKSGAGEREKLDMVVRNLSQFLVQDQENETAYLRLPEGGYWWYWYGSEVEANAYYLKLLTRVDPRGVTAPRLVKYLLNNRKHSTYWNSTRDTALCVEAFADHIRATGEAQPDMVVEVWIDGAKKKEVSISGENLFTFDNKFVLAGADVPTGEHRLELRRRGRGAVYFNAYLTNFTREDSITKAGLEVKVERKFYRLVPVDQTATVAGTRGQPVGQKVEKYRREPLAELAQLASGELVEVELEIESKNDYEYLIFEDMKAAGFEPVELRSGYAANGLGAYTEYRDNRVTFFLRTLARGRHSVSYRLRAETPGRFSALPAHAAAMYAPELTGNSDEMKLLVADDKP